MFTNLSFLEYMVSNLSAHRVVSLVYSGLSLNWFMDLLFVDKPSTVVGIVSVSLECTYDR